MDRLDPRQLEVFLAVVETGSVSLAARRLRLTQPTVSRDVAQLERLTGLVLFDRGRGGMRPTAEGLLFAEEVRRTFAGLDRITASAEAIRRGAQGQVVVAALPIYADGFVIRALGALAGEMPEVRARVETQLIDEILRKVLHDQIDLGVVAGPFLQPPRIETVVLGRRRLMAVMRHDHPLAGRREVGVAELAGADLVLMAQSNPHRALVVQAFASAGVMLRSRLEAASQRGAAGLALASGAVTLVDQELAGELARLDDRVRIAPFTATPAWNVVAIRQKGRPLSIAGEATLRHLEQAMAETHG